MKIAGEQPLSARRERVWELFNDPNRLSRLVPGLEKLDVLGPDEFAGTINVGIAAVKGVYSGTLELGSADSNQTLVRYSGDMQIGGPLMQVGQRMIESAAKMMLGQFFAAADAELQAAAAGTVARQG